MLILNKKIHSKRKCKLFFNVYNVAFSYSNSKNFGRYFILFTELYIIIIILTIKLMKKVSHIQSVSVYCHIREKNTKLKNGNLQDNPCWEE